MYTLTNLDKAVLRKLLARKVIGSRHMQLVTLTKCGWKPHEKGQVKESVDKLLKMGYLIWAKKSKKAITLNKELIDDVNNCFS